MDSNRLNVESGDLPSASAVKDYPIMSSLHAGAPTGVTDDVEPSPLSVRPKVLSPTYPHPENATSTPSKDNKPPSMDESVLEDIKLIKSFLFEKTSKVFPLTKFNFQGGEDLTSYFDRFEAYCGRLYPGAELGKTEMLGSYLEGPVRDVFDQAYSINTDYNSVKRQLLDWYGTVKSRKEKTKKNMFATASLGAGESLTTFGKRLQTLFNLNFPLLKAEETNYLRMKFLECLPNKLSQTIRSAVSFQEKVSKQDMDWDTFLDVSEECYRNLMDWESKNQNSSSSWSPLFPWLNKMNPQRETTWPDPLNGARGLGEKPWPVVQPPMGDWQDWWFNPLSRSSFPQGPGPQSLGVKGVPETLPLEEVQTGPIFSNKRSVSHNDPGSSSYGKSWKSSFCTFCGLKNHSVSECRKRPLCEHCQKRGHAASQCYSALGICPKCKEKGHDIKHCKNRSSVKCPICRGTHLGINCPYSAREQPEN